MCTGIRLTCRLPSLKTRRSSKYAGFNMRVGDDRKTVINPHLGTYTSSWHTHGIDTGPPEQAHCYYSP